VARTIYPSAINCRLTKGKQPRNHWRLFLLSVRIRRKCSIKQQSLSFIGIWVSPTVSEVITFLFTSSSAAADRQQRAHIMYYYKSKSRRLYRESTHFTTLYLGTSSTKVGTILFSAFLFIVLL
jgi:hypothetical protein